ncbi:hypothetical protein CKAH01_17315 [Colletotrichum kahawae]|uniref:Uncharacterized protein n=1 Tax=Colletotrichum kahawae TaxID=34407 RepID=A0AAE0D5A8_COLKA|nr:hypothetical protein CKAH01_17315 [Colletotrichum kahawae]
MAGSDGRDGRPPTTLSGVPRTQLFGASLRARRMQFFVGNAPIRRNTWALNVNISPTDSGQRTRRLAEIDAQIAVVCHVGGSLWNWEGAGKDFPAAWKEFVGQNKVSHEAICRLSILIGAPPLPESETWTVEEGQLLIASTDGVAITEAAFAFFDFGPKAQVSSDRDRRLSARGDRPAVASGAPLRQKSPVWWEHHAMGAVTRGGKEGPNHDVPASGG